MPLKLRCGRVPGSLARLPGRSGTWPSVTSPAGWDGWGRCRAGSPRRFRVLACGHAPPWWMFAGGVETAAGSGTQPSRGGNGLDHRGGGRSPSWPVRISRTVATAVIQSWRRVRRWWKYRPMSHETPAEDRPSDADRERDLAGRRDIDAEQRATRDAARAAELDERQRRLESREAYQDAVRDERDRMADERDRVADAREQRADQREAQADQRELAALEPFMQPETYDADEHGHPPRPSPPRRTQDPRPPHDPGEP